MKKTKAQAIRRVVDIDRSIDDMMEGGLTPGGPTTGNVIEHLVERARLSDVVESMPDWSGSKHG